MSRWQLAKLGAQVEVAKKKPPSLAALILQLKLEAEQKKRKEKPKDLSKVRTNPVNGRKAIYVGAHASHIEGRDVEEGRALLRRLTEFVSQPQFLYTHQWKPGDLVMWDNRAVLHRGKGWDEAKYKRVMHRTTVAGSGPTVEDGQAFAA